MWQNQKQKHCWSRGASFFCRWTSCGPIRRSRRIFDETALQELAASIRQYGVLQPLSVRRKADGYELVAGERRLRAAKLAGLRSVPCVLLVLDDTQSGLVALVENLQRKDLDYLEEAAGLAQLIRRYGLSQEQAAARIGKSQSAVANKLRLLQLSAPVLQTLRPAICLSGTPGRCCGCRTRRPGWLSLRRSSSGSSMLQRRRH